MELEINMIHCSAAISMLSAQWDMALALLDSKAHQADTVSCNAMLRVYAKNVLWQPALDMLWGLQAGGNVDVVSYSTAISACERASRWSAALGVLAQMSAFATRPNVFTYSTLLSTCGKAEKWAVALTCLDGMLPHFMQPNLITFNSAITSCDRGLQWHLALLSASTLSGKSLDTDAISCRAAMSACQKVGMNLPLTWCEGNMAVRMLCCNLQVGRWARVLSLHQRASNEGLSLGEVGCRSAIDACDTEWHRALALFAASHCMRVQKGHMGHMGHSEDASVALSSLMSDGLPWPTVVTLLDDMRRSATRPNDVCTNSVVKVYAQHQWALALQLTREERFQNFNWNAAIAACQRAGSWQRGCYMLDAPGVDAVGYNSALQDVEKWEHAWSLFGKLCWRGLQRTAVRILAALEMRVIELGQGPC